MYDVESFISIEALHRQLTKIVGACTLVHCFWILGSDPCYCEVHCDICSEFGVSVFPTIFEKQIQIERVYVIVQ